ncbi:hypothetical protein DBR40_24035 [Pedobacter sp. KBW01]|nr:hypothetical protein DBR40_24035 [Pedobacter sp. KBW01]
MIRYTVIKDQGYKSVFADIENMVKNIVVRFFINAYFYHYLRYNGDKQQQGQQPDPVKLYIKQTSNKARQHQQVINVL